MDRVRAPCSVFLIDHYEMVARLLLSVLLQVQCLGFFCRFLTVDIISGLKPRLFSHYQHLFVCSPLDLLSMSLFVQHSPSSFRFESAVIT